MEVRGGNVFKTGVTGWQGTDGLSLGYGRQCEAQPSEGGPEGTARGTGWTVRQQEGQGEGRAAYGLGARPLATNARAG